MPSGSFWNHTGNNGSARSRRENYYEEVEDWRTSHPKSNYLWYGETDISDDEWRRRVENSDEDDDMFLPF